MRIFKKLWQSQTLSTGLAIFSMLFGAGNLMFPLKLGIIAGTANWCALTGFLITGVLLPVAGLISVLLFDGNYHAFFGRAGKIPGALLTFFCILILGPLIAMPRIVTLSYVMMSQTLPAGVSLTVFTIFFLGITYALTYRQNKIVDILGTVISPILVLCLGIIILKGLLFPAHGATVYSDQLTPLFGHALLYGYNTLDLLGSIFFSAIIVRLLCSSEKSASCHTLALLGLRAGFIGSGLLALVYIGLSYVGVFNGAGLELIGEGHVFSAVAFRVLGFEGAFITSAAVLMACLSTIIALAAVVAEYVQNILADGSISFEWALAFVLGLTALTSHYGLDAILQFSSSIIINGYPLIITLTLCNLAYKLWGVQTVKLPLAVVAIISLAKLLFY